MTHLKVKLSSNLDSHSLIDCGQVSKPILSLGSLPVTYSDGADNLLEGL